TPDGDRLVVNTTKVPVINEIIRKTSLWHVAISGGVLHHIADYPGGAGSTVVRVIDGNLVAVSIASDGRDDPAASIWVVPLAGGTPRNLTPGYTGTFFHLEPDPTDRAQVIAKIVEGVHSRIFRVNLATGDIAPIAPAGLAENGTISSDPSIAADGSAVAMIWESSDKPREVFVGELGSEVTAITDFGSSFDERLFAGEKVTWKSTDGVKIEGILIRPPGFVEGTRVPLIVEIHGGPSWQWEDRMMLDWHDWAQMLASRGYAVLLPNPRGSTGYGSDFEKLLISDVGGGETQDIISGALAMVERGIADPEKLGVGGWSWGGFLTASTITQTTIFHAAVMGAGVANLISDHAAGDIPEANMAYYPGHPYTHWDLYAKASPIRLAANAKTPTLILHGDSDIRVHPTQGQEFYRALKENGVPVQFVKYPREGHGFQERAHQIDLMKRIVDWYERYIPAI
ncbi:MAG TPA: S9 family peptidase, partial [Thermomicrobiales bacterium]|nr:S9 family peptidase [Thermomicrobiales bacterium]